MTIHFDPPPIPQDGPLPLPALRAWLDQAKPSFESVRLKPVSGDVPAAGVPSHEKPVGLHYLPAACLTRTAQIDQLIAALVGRLQHRQAALAHQTVLLFALGSYGRRELCPHSDIDLLLLHSAETSAEYLKEFVSGILTPLWDCGIAATQVVYAPADVAALAERMATIDDLDPAAVPLQKQWTSFLDAREVPIAPPSGTAAATATDRPLAAEFTRMLQTFQREHGFSFARHKAREILDRHAALHIRRWEIPSPGYLEPNLKDGVGGLRDALATHWISSALESRTRTAPEADAAQPLARARTRILAARCLLHSAAGRIQERLLQGLQGEVTERLLMQMQPEAWSDEPGDRLQTGMALLYDALNLVHGHATTACREVEQGARRGRTPTARQQLERETLSPHFSRVGGELHPTAEGEKALRSAAGLTVALSGCELALQEQLTPAARWGERLRAITHSDSAPTAAVVPEAVASFNRILAQPRELYPVLTWMHRARLLTALIPEFAAITGRTQRAPLHEVTVDVHTLRVVGALEHWHQSERTEDKERVALLNGLPQRNLLRLAALLHDIGKSRGDAGHPERGSVMAHDILTRLHVPPADIRLVRILIEEHLALFNLTTLDPTDHGPFDRLARRLESVAMIDRLYLLTIADAQGVAVGALPLWREDRLRGLWLSLREKAAAHPTRDGSTGDRTAQSTLATSRGTTDDSPASALRESLLAALPDPLHGLGRGRARADLLRLRRRLNAHLQNMPARYLTRVSAEDALGHVRLIARLGRLPAVLEQSLQAESTPLPGPGTADSKRGGGRHARPPKNRPRKSPIAAAALRPTGNGEAVGKLSIVTRDRPGRFSQICAGLTGAGLTVVSAEVYERSDGLILDEFRVMPAPAFAAGVAPGQMQAHLGQLLRQADALILEILRSPAKAAEVMARMRAHPLHAAPRPAGAPRADAEVTLMDASHEPLTIVDVRCADRPGLLYALTRAIADLGLNIHFATIDTVRGMATDVFYVSESTGGNLKDAERRLHLRMLLKAVADQAG